MKLVTLKEACRKLDISLDAMLNIRRYCVFPDPKCRKGQENLFEFDAIKKAVQNRVSIKTGNPIRNYRSDLSTKRKEPVRKEENIGGQYIHYGEYEANKEWLTHLGSSDNLEFSISE